MAIDRVTVGSVEIVRVTDGSMFGSPAFFFSGIPSDMYGPALGPDPTSNGPVEVAFGCFLVRSSGTTLPIDPGLVTHLGTPGGRPPHKAGRPRSAGDPGGPHEYHHTRARRRRGLETFRLRSGPKGQVGSRPRSSIRAARGRFRTVAVPDGRPRSLPTHDLMGTRPALSTARAGL